MHWTNVLMTTFIMGCSGAVIGFILCAVDVFFASDKINIKSKKEIAVLNALPGYNCGACGYPNCAALADNIVNGKASPDSCTVGKEKTHKAIKEILQQVTTE